MSTENTPKPEDSVPPASDPKDAKPGVTPPTTYEVGGKAYTLEELTKLAGEAHTAKAQSEEAQQVKSRAEKAIKVLEDLKGIRDGDFDPLRRLGKALKLPSDKLEEAIAVLEKGDTEDDPKPARKGRQDVTHDPDSPIPFDKLPVAVQRLMIEGEQDRQQRIIESALAVDPTIGYHIGKGGENKENLLELTRTLVNAELATKRAGFDDGSKVLAQVLPIVRKHAKGLGTETSKPARTGLGQAPGATGTPNTGPDKLKGHTTINDSDAYAKGVVEDFKFFLNQ